MGNLLAVLPLAFVMVAGPQIVSAIFLATSERPRANSVAYVGGAAISISLAVIVVYFLSEGVSGSLRPSGGGGSSVAHVATIVLLLLLMVYVFLRRKQSEPPRWMGRLQGASPRLSFTVGFLLLGLFPTDILTSASVGAYLSARDQPVWYAAPFLLVTLLFLAAPLLATFVLGRRAETLLPAARNWMNTNSWIVSEIVLVFFLVVTVAGG